MAGRLGVVGACYLSREAARPPLYGTGPPHAAVVLTLFATDAKRSSEPASLAVCRGQILVPIVKACLDECVGSHAVSTGAVEGLFSGEGGSLAGVPFEPGNGGYQYQAGD